MNIDQVLTTAQTQAMPVLLRFYTPGTPLLDLLLTHSRNVARKALDCMTKHPEVELNPVSVARAALLHDIGIIRCDAKGIHCFGTEPYIHHGIIGRSMLEPLGFTEEAMVCERHTGAGITAEEIEMAQMNLPVRDMVPVTMLEKLVCYADKFYSKSGDPNREKEAAAIRVALSKYGSATMQRFDELHRLFG